MPTATANGKKFTFPEGTTPDQMGEAIDSYFAQQPAAPAQPDPTRVDHGATPSPYRERIRGMNPAMQALMGVGGAVNNLVLGAQQLIPDALTSPEYRADLARQVAEQKKAMDAVENTTAGMAGSVAGNIGAAIPAGMALTAAAPAGVLGAVGAGVLEGGLMGALAPTTQPGERAENMAWGAGLGGALPAAGHGLRAAVGRGDAPVQEAAKVLERYGVNVSPSRQAGGAINDWSDRLLEKTPVISALARSSADADTDKVRSALFRMLGADTPGSNEEMAGILSRVGGDIGNITKSSSIPVGAIKPGIDEVMKSYKNLLPSQRSPQVLKYAEDLGGLSEIKGARLKGAAYQAIRSDMAAEAAGTSPEHARALRGMVKVLDDQFAKTLSPEDAATLAERKRQYRLAKVLAKQDIKAGGMDVGKARAAIERAAQKGGVMPEARDLLNAADVGIPKIKDGMATLGGMASASAAVHNPMLMAKALAGAVGAKALLNTGMPQRLANSPLLRTATARALKGAMQRELSDEE